MSERDDAPVFRDHDEPPLPDPHVAWAPALAVAFGVTFLMLVLTIAVAVALGLEAPAPGGEETGDEAALLTISLVVLVAHALLLRYALRRFARYDIGLGWAVLAAVLGSVLTNLGVLGLVVAVPAQAAVLRFRSEPHASLVDRGTTGGPGSREQGGLLGRRVRRRD
jgi:membrane protease YdiL (CAAX protease family)